MYGFTKSTGPIFTRCYFLYLPSWPVKKIHSKTGNTAVINNLERCRRCRRRRRRRSCRVVELLSCGGAVVHKLSGVAYQQVQTRWFRGTSADHVRKVKKEV
jgi:hypothetical protein